MTPPDDAVTPPRLPKPPASGYPASRPPSRGLGRGLGALIPRGEAGLQEMELDRIAPNPQQPRLRIDEASLAELAESIRQHGLLQPVVVARVEGQAEGFFLVAGERRWRAARLAGLTTVPAVIKDAAPRQRLELALVENIQREDLLPLELATAYRALIDEHGLTQEEVAQRIGKSRVAVTNTLRLLQLPRSAREALAEGRISEGHARALLSAPDERTLLSGLREVVARGLTVRQSEELVRRLGERGYPPGGSAEQQGSRAAERVAPPPDAVELGYLEERFRQALGTRVQIVRARRGGRLVIHFYSDEELEGLYEAIVGG